MYLNDNDEDSQTGLSWEAKNDTVHRQRKI